MASWLDLKDDVEKGGNVITTTMEKLRDAQGSGRLGVHVIAEISRELAGMGLGHVPVNLPSYQNDPVRLYKRGTPIGDLIDTVLTPGQSNDEKLAAQFTDDGANNAALLQKIRELVSA